MRTQEEIKAEIEKLKAMKPDVHHFTRFGDDNWAVIDAQIRVLDEKMSDDDIWDQWPSDERDVYERDAAREALAWQQENSYDSPSDTWRDVLITTSKKATPAKKTKKAKK